MKITMYNVTEIMYIFQKMFHVGQKNMDIVDQILCVLEDTRRFLGNADFGSILWPICISIIIIMVSHFLFLTHKIFNGRYAILEILY